MTRPFADERARDEARRRIDAARRAKLQSAIDPLRPYARREALTDPALANPGSCEAINGLFSRYPGTRCNRPANHGRYCGWHYRFQDS